MKFAYCNVSIVPVRSNPNDRSEMVSQMLFGETMEVLEKGANWAHIRMSFDQYEGWVDPKQIVLIDDEEMNRIQSAAMCFVTDMVQVLQNKEVNQLTPLVIGSHLPGLQYGSFHMAGQKLSYDGMYIDDKVEPKRASVLENAMVYLNAPYLWGGKTPFGIDCSGFTQQVFKVSGIPLLRNASQQSLQGETINFITDAHPGDLAFFDNEEGSIIHVGILMGENKIMHASGKVRIDAVDHQGIFNVDSRTYTHKLRIIKNYFVK